MKVPKLLAAGLIAAGLVIGGSTVAHATTASPYVTVAWSYAGHPDLTQPQPYIASAPGADLHAFDALAATPAWCGQPIQVDVYKVTDEHGRSWETLKTSGSLQYGTDGGFLAYDAGIGTPYRVIAPKEIPCTTPTQPSSSPTPSASSSPTPDSSPTATVTPSPSASPSQPTGPTSSPSPSAPAEPTPTPSSSTSPSTPASPPTGGPTPTGTHQPTATATPSTPRSERKSTPSATASAAPASSPTSTDQLAYTGANPWPGITAASVLILLGAALLLARRVRRG